MKKTLLCSILFYFLLFLTACTSDSETTNDADLTVYTSLYPIQYAVERIGGDSVTVHSVFPPGVDAHSYEPTSKDMTKIARSNAFIYLGAGMESFSTSIADALSDQDVQLYQLGKHDNLFLPNHEEDEHHMHDGHNHGDWDPHIWLDPNRMVGMAYHVKDVLTELNPEKKDLYEQNLDSLEKDLEELDLMFMETLQEKSNNKMLVSHAAFGYWEERYGIEQISVHGLSSNKEPSQKELTKIIRQAEENQIGFIIFEQNTSSRVSEIVREHIGAEAVTIHNLAVLTEDDLANGSDYLSLMKENLNTLDRVMK